MDSITAGAAAPRRKPGLLINRDYAFLWLGQSVSIVGDMMFTTTLVIWLATGLGAHQSWAPVAVSAVLIAAAAPTLLVGVFAGVFVDRARKRPLMLWMDALRTLIVAALIVATGVFPRPFVAGARLPLVWTLGLIYGVVALVNIGEQFFRPSSIALVQELVPTELQARAMGLSQASISLALIIGPSLAAPLYAAFGPEWSILIDAASFAISFLTILAIREPTGVAAGAPAAQQSAAEPKAGFWHELMTGVRFYFSNRVLVALLVGAIVALLGASAINTLDVFFATENLHATTAMYGLLGGAMGIGSILGSVVFGFLAQRIGLARTLWMSLAMFGVVVVILARTTNYDIALGFFVVTGILNAGLNVAVGPLLMRETPNHLMGRIMSIFQPAISLAILVGTALVGYLAGVTLRGFHAVALGQTFGAVDTIWLGGGVLMFLSGLVTMVGLTGVDRRYRAEDRAAAESAAASNASSESATAATPEVSAMVH